MLKKQKAEGCDCLICNRPMKKIATGKEWEYYRCTACNWFNTKLISPDNSSMNYEHYETFDNNIDNFDTLVSDAERILQHKFDQINRFPKSFLDVGTSEGVFVKAYNNLSHTDNGVGVEVSLSKIDRAKKRGLNVVHFDELKNRQFDFILLRHVIEHISDPKSYLQTIMKWLSTNGILCVETPNNDSWLLKMKGRHINDIKEDVFVRELYPPVHVCGFTPGSMRKIGGVCGMNLMRLETYDHRNLDYVYKKDAAGNGRISIYSRIFEKLHMGPGIAAFFSVR